MPRDLDEWPSRLKAVEREYVALRLAVTRLMTQVGDDSTILTRDDVRRRDIGTAAENLEGTYFTRLFAEFETALRLFWGKERTTHPQMRDLVDGVAATCRIPYDLTAEVHAAREFRNSLIHERQIEVTRVPISSARSALCRFLSRLPENWT